MLQKSTLHRAELTCLLGGPTWQFGGQISLMEFIFSVLLVVQMGHNTNQIFFMTNKSFLHVIMKIEPSYNFERSQSVIDCCYLCFRMNNSCLLPKLIDTERGTKYMKINQ